MFYLRATSDGHYDSRATLLSSAANSTDHKYVPGHRFERMFDYVKDPAYYILKEDTSPNMNFGSTHVQDDADEEEE